MTFTAVGMMALCTACVLGGGMAAMLAAFFLPRILTSDATIQPGALLIGAMITGCAALICSSWIR